MLKRMLSDLGLYISYLIVCGIVKLRYRLEVVGLDKLTPESFKRPGGVVFLPNHPAEIDPVLVEIALFRRFRPRPLIVEHFYHLKFFKFFLDLARVLPMPSMDTAANKWRAKKLDKQFNTIVEQLKNKENFLIYPSGRLKISGVELIGGASFTHHLLEKCPEANVVLVRTTGLWGSMFSRALTGASPDFGKTAWDGIKILLKNGLFFAPHRHVKIEVELPPADFPYQSSRLELNKYLENWYNRYPEPGPEPLSLVSYAFWKLQLPKVFAPMEMPKNDVVQRPVSTQIQNEVFKELATLSKQPIEKIQRTMHLSHDLGLDSLDVAELYIFLDERYQVKNLLPGDIRTVEDLLQAAAGYMKERENGSAVVSVVGGWPEEKCRRFLPEIPPGKTIQEVFFLSCDRHAESLACADAISGALTYKRFKMAALILSQKLKEIPEDKIGVLLPSSVGAYLSIFAILCAGKVPVMLNWTAGTRVLDYTDELTHLGAVISSDRFLDRLENGELGKIENKLLLMEDLRKKISWKDKIQGLFLSFKKSDALLKKLKLTKISETDPAVILFTSGTETLPKGVPLSHRNLLENQRASLSCVNFQPEDVLYGVLPPFHSFGLSITGILPILAGLKVCYAPDPNDSHGMVQDIARWKVSLFCCAPSFIRALFRVADPEKLRTFRIVVSGAEKTPQELFDYVKQHLPQTHLLEGYGITECSPVVSIDRLDRQHKGVGLPIPGQKIKVIDMETGAVLPLGKEGEICICGPNVFSGYIGSDRNPFIQLEGERYYRSGDQGFLGADGTLNLAGRMKRFVKIGGEMVSLGGLEDELLKIASEKKWTSGQDEGPPLAVTAKEKDSDKPEIVLFTTFVITKEDVNNALKEHGYGRIVKIGDVRKIDHIPLTGTGKTHYRLLDEMLTQR